MYHLLSEHITRARGLEAQPCATETPLAMHSLIWRTLIHLTLSSPRISFFSRSCFGNSVFICDMAEVIAGFAAVSSVLQIFDFSTKVATHVHQLLSSNTNASVENLETERLARKYRALAELACHDGGSETTPTPEEEVVKRLGRECREEAHKLIKMLEELKVVSGCSRTTKVLQGTRKAARSLLKKQDIEKRRKYLQEINGQLATAFLCILHKDKEKQEALSAETIQTLTNSSVQEIDRVLHMREVAEVERKKADRIIESLEFPEMSLRRFAIPNAYDRTYGWIFDEEAHDFAHWLRNGQDIYWVSGKAGCGKSTLMKFIGGHERTQDLLSVWAGSHRLVFAEFFFWYLGTTLQKSVEGLLRSILFQILRNCPSWVKTAFPAVWEGRHQQLMGHFSQWSEQELTQALHDLATYDSEVSQDPQQAESTMFCFFIDGLDEYNGDHVALVKLLAELERNPKIKLCLSSRPWNAFKNAYANIKPSLRLEDLTRPDIEFYVTGHLHSIKSERNVSGLFGCFDIEPSEEAETTLDLYEELVEEITTKAEGVFLWVYLAVKSVLRGHDEGDSLIILRERVREFPPDLESFFKNILSRVERVYADRTAQALKLAHLQATSSAEWGDRLSSFINVWLMQVFPKGLQKPDFPYQIPIREYTDGEIKTMAGQADMFLSACCKDLLWVPHVSPYIGSLEGRRHSPIRVTKVDFLHRTVYDFLCTDYMQVMLNERVPNHFKDGRINHLLNLAQAKFIPKQHVRECVANDLGRTSDLSITAQWSGLTEQYVQDFGAVAQAWTSRLDSLELETERLGDTDRSWSRDPRMLELFAAFRKNNYIRKVCLGPEGSKNPFRLEIILKAALGLSTFQKFHLPVADLGFVKELLAFGADPNGMWHTKCNRTIWLQFLIRWATFSDTVSEDPEAQNQDRDRDSDHLAIWRLAAAQITSGANLHVTSGVCRCAQCHAHNYDRIPVPEMLERLCPPSSREELKQLLVWRSQKGCETTLPLRTVQELAPTGHNASVSTSHTSVPNGSWEPVPPTVLLPP